MFLILYFASLVLVWVFTYRFVYWLDCTLLFWFLFLFFFFLFLFSSLHFSLWLCVSLGVLVCWVLLSPFVLEFYLSIPFLCLFVSMFVWVSFLLFIFKFFFLSIIFSVFLSLSLLCCVAWVVLVLQLGVRPEAPRWETQVQDGGPPDNSWPHETLINESSPKRCQLNAKTRPHPKVSKLQCQRLYAKPRSK